MSVKNKIEQIKDKAARVAIKAAAVATLMTGAGVVSSCQENNRNTDENKDKIENTENTSVVFRSTHNSNKYVNSTDILLENGDEFRAYDEDRFIEPGDTITYEANKQEGDLTEGTIKAVRYKGDAEVKKKVDFRKIGRIGKDRTD